MNTRFEFFSSLEDPTRVAPLNFPDFTSARTGAFSSGKAITACGIIPVRTSPTSRPGILPLPSGDTIAISLVWLGALK
jgi:hypothetical protein